MKLFQRLNAPKEQERSAVDLMSALTSFGFGGNTYPLGLNQTLSGHVESIAPGFGGYVAAAKACPPVFGAQLVRGLILSQAKFTWRGTRGSGNAGKKFGTQALSLLERPWPKGTTGNLVSKMEWHAGLAGNSFVWRNRKNDTLHVLRPDWTTVVWGSEMEEQEDAGYALDRELLGFYYQPGGRGKGHALRPQDVAHWSPVEDPLSPSLGMSWVTPAIREIQGDIAASDHKLQFFANGATPNLVVKGITAGSLDQFKAIVRELEEGHAGVANAYKTLYLSAGADASVIGSDMQQIDFKATVGTGETRISLLSRVPASVLQISEGLQGSSLNAGNFGASRRLMADTWVSPTLDDLCGALADICDVPAGGELWHDDDAMPFLREDGKDAADIEAVKATTITAYVRDGFTPESSVAAVEAQDVSLLVHTGFVSVQLQKPGQTNEGGTDAA